MRRFVVGDIHGELDKLIQVLNLCGFDNLSDLLISIGDLSDRGKDSWGVVELLMSINNLIFIRGNHDYQMLQWLHTGNYNQNWLVNGGDKTVSSYEDVKMKNKDKHVSFYESAIPYYVIDNKCFVHGGLNPDFLIEEHSEESLCRDRSLADKQCFEDKAIVCKNNFDEIFIGHTPTFLFDSEVPIIKHNVINIDTGCGKGGPLSIMDIDTKEYWQSSFDIEILKQKKFKYKRIPNFQRKS